MPELPSFKPFLNSVHVTHKCEPDIHRKKMSLKQTNSLLPLGSPSIISEVSRDAFLYCTTMHAVLHK